MQNLPLYISTTLFLATFYAVFMFVKAANGNRKVMIVLLTWLFLQGLIASTGFYTQTTGMPPRFFLSIGPAFLAIILLFTTEKGHRFLDGLQVRQLTLLHIVRVPVELVLFWLFLHKAIPEVMTFEGRNFDVLSGITAPLAFYFLKNNINRKLLLLWNFVCLALLVNIVMTAALAAPFDFQQIAFDQPNIAVFYFPFIWLPALIVPLVLLSHLVTIRKIWRNEFAVSKLPQAT